jgi:hypothetical protein
MKTNNEQLIDRSANQQTTRKAIIYARARHLSSNGSDTASEAAHIEPPWV